MKKKLLYGLLAVLCLFVITNPSPTAFKAFRGKNTYTGLIREHNYFIYSTYQDSTYDDDKDRQHRDRYVGFVGNFWPIGKPVSKQVASNETKEHKLSVNEFAEKIKAKYPEYSRINNRELVTKILNKYPVYKENVDTNKISQ